MASFLNLTDEIWKLEVPLPFSLRSVNSYLLRGADGYTVIDPGLHTADAENAWLAALALANVPFHAIERIVLTHHHPDHYGLSGWLQQQTGAPVFMSQEGIRQRELFWGDHSDMAARMHLLFQRHGLTGEALNGIVPHMRSFLPQVNPQPDALPIEAGASFRMGSRSYTPLLTPGHAQGHLCFLDEERHAVFCGDHVLPLISPNVAYAPEGDPDPLASYLDSLEASARWRVELAYPGHRDPFGHFNARAQELSRHHDLRLQQVLRLTAGPISAYECCRAMFGERLDIHQLRFAMGETLAHLVYLERREYIRSMEDGGCIRWAAVSPHA